MRHVGAWRVCDGKLGRDLSGRLFFFFFFVSRDGADVKLKMMMLRRCWAVEEKEIRDRIVLCKYGRSFGGADRSSREDEKVDFGNGALFGSLLGGL